MISFPPSIRHGAPSNGLTNSEDLCRMLSALLAPVHSPTVVMVMVLLQDLATAHPVPDLAMAHPVPDLAMAHPAPDLAMALPVPDLVMAHLAPDPAMAHLVPDQAMAHPVPDPAMEHPVPDPAMAHLVPDPDTVAHAVAMVVNMVPVPRSAMVLVPSLAIMPVPSLDMEHHLAAMVNLPATVHQNLLDTAHRTATEVTEVNSHTSATEQTYKRIMK